MRVLMVVNCLELPTKGLRKRTMLLRLVDLKMNVGR